MNVSCFPLPSFDKKLLKILACPITKSSLVYDELAQELVSNKAGLAFPIRNGIPILLKEDARSVSTLTSTILSTVE